MVTGQGRILGQLELTSAWEGSGGPPGRSGPQLPSRPLFPRHQDEAGRDGAASLIAK